MNTIQLFRPSLGRDELRMIKRCFNSGWITLGPLTEEFEREFSNYNKVKYCVGVNSATSAIDLSIKALGLKEGNVIVPAITFVATAFAAINNNLEVKFCDVDRNTLCMDPSSLNEQIDRKTRAIIPVHIGGQPCDMKSIREVIDKRKIAIIEDCANSLGSEIEGIRVGNFGEFGCFSFNALKTITTGEGGMVTTNDEKSYSKLRKLRLFGIDRTAITRYDNPNRYPWHYDIKEIGYKYNMFDIQAAIGLAQLRKISRLDRQRDKYVELYNEELKELERIEIPPKIPGSRNVHWLYTIKLDPSIRDDFVEFMFNRGIHTGVHWMPLYRHTYFRRIRSLSLPNAELVWRRIVDLPCYSSLTMKEFHHIITSIKSFFGNR